MNSKVKVLSGYGIFNIINHILLITLAILCILPMINVLSISFSSASKIAAGEVKLLPVEFTLNAYKLVLKDKTFWHALLVSVERVILGSVITVALTIITAYPLSKNSRDFRARRYYVWYIFFTMLFNGGMIPGFLVVYFTGLYNSIWALIIPGAIAPFSVILMLNFFRQLPNEMEEAAFMDGAGHWTILWQIVVPVSKPVIATITLFTMVNHWNAWFDAVLYLKKTQDYPLQAYLQSLLSAAVDISKYLTPEEMSHYYDLTPRNLRAAQIFIAAFPILITYPFLQKYFAKGLVIGSVKG